MAKLIANIYSDALFELAVEKNCVSTLREEGAFLAKSWKDNPELVRFLAHPQISREEKQETLERIFGGQVSPDWIGLLRVMVEKDRQRELPAVFEAFEQSVKEYYRIGTVFVTTPMELTEKQKERLMARLLETTSYRSLEMNYLLDPSLLGGLVIRIKDRVFDSSIKNRLEHLTRELRKAAVVSH